MLHRSCCCGGDECSLRDCIFNETIDTGCCHLKDDLMLWIERPGFVNSQHYTCPGFGLSPPCEVTYSIVNDECSPIQAIYKYYGCYWRAQFAPNLNTYGFCSPLPSRCGGDVSIPCEIGGIDWTGGTCCTDFAPTGCSCNHSWLSPRRKYQLSGFDPRYPSPCKWLIEWACHKNGTTLGCGASSMYNEVMCIIYHERWWRIPDGNPGDFCPPGTRIYVANCDDGSARSTWVPRYWIYACSGVPLMSWELTDATTRGWITGSEEAEIRSAFSGGSNPDQALMVKLSKGGYFDTGDWRDEQRQAYVELNIRFPGAGYAALIQPACDMAPLGPFRKRLTAPFASASVQPCLRKSDLYSTAVPLNGQTMIPYPGSLGNQADYEYWADRQWVYFRAVSGGWQWAGWSVNDDDILNGARGDQTCLEGFKNVIRPSSAIHCVGGVCQLGPPYICCNDCTNCGCGACLQQSCEPPPPTYFPTSCSNFVVAPTCQGIQFVWAEYYMNNDLNAGGTAANRIKCLFTARAWLVEARRSSLASTSCLYECEGASLNVFRDWPAIENGHYGPAQICDDIVSGIPPIYDADDLCCSGHCYTLTGGSIPPGTNCLHPDGVANDCMASVQCPPSQVPSQVSCIGFDPECFP